jgi:hypothetical protein
VLGDMLELGPEAEALHRALGREAAFAGLAGLAAVWGVCRADRPRRARGRPAPDHDHPRSGGGRGRRGGLVGGRATGSW